MAFSKLSHSAAGVTGKSVYVTYTLTASDANVAFAFLSIGYTIIDLVADQVPGNPWSFKSRGPHEYLGLQENDGILVSVNATGKAGCSWTLEISIDGTALSDNPIKETTNLNGYLNHNQKQN